MAKETTLADKNAHQFPVFIDQPPGGIKGGLIVIHEVWGLNDHTKDIASRLSKEGYFTLAPELLSDTGILEHRAEFQTIQEQLFDPKRSTAVQPNARRTQIHDSGARKQSVRTVDRRVTGW